MEPLIQLYAYQIPFRKPFVTAGEEYLHREGLLLVAKRNAYTAYGEIAPLPGFSAESLAEVTPLVRTILAEQSDLFRDGSPLLIKQFMNEIDVPPSVRFGFDMLALDMLAKQHRCTITDVLGLKSTDTLKVNGVVGSGSATEMAEQVDKLVSVGYTTIKCKVGRVHEKELKLLELIRARHPQIAIRLDANQAWEVEEAIGKLNDFARFDVEYCEQPVSRSDLEGLGEVSKKVSIAVAADEAADSKDAVFELITRDLCDVLIIKPMVFGSIDDLIVTKSLADTHLKKIVFTTSLESLAGRCMTAELAAGLGTTSMAHGLSTGELLTEHMVLPEVSGGTYLQNRGPGLQIEPDLRYHQLIQ